MELNYTPKNDRLDNSFDNEKCRRSVLKVRDALHLTLKTIAKATGVTESTVSRYLNGCSTIPAAWADRFCQAFCVDAEWIEKGSGHPVFTDEVQPSVTADTSGAGDRLRQMRKELGLVQKEVYEPLGITRTMYSRLENGHAGVSLENAQKIEEIFGCGVDWLLYGDEEKKLYPAGKKMIEWLWAHEEERKMLWEKMEEEEP